MKTETPTVPESRLLVGVEAVARMLDVSVRTVWAMNQTGELGPLPVHLRRRSLWRADELQEWVNLNCPPRERWVAMKKN